MAIRSQAPDLRRRHAARLPPPDPSVRPRRTHHAHRPDAPPTASRSACQRPTGSTSLFTPCPHDSFWSLMPRSIQDILDHADELASTLRELPTGPGDERPVEEFLLDAALARARANDRSSRPSPQPAARSVLRHASASSSAPRPKQPNSATATSSLPAALSPDGRAPCVPLWAVGGC